MPTLTTATTVTFPIQVDQVLTLTNNFGAGRVVLSAQKGGDAVISYTGAHLRDAPVFSAGSQGIVTITHLSGSLTYDLTPSAFPLFQNSPLLAVGVPWANRVAPSVAGVGAQFWADVGNNVTPILMRSDGTNWRPVAPSAIARKTDTNITQGGSATIGQTADQMIGRLGPIPAGLLFSGAIFLLRYTLGRDVNTDAYGTSTNLRLGTAGTIADTSLSSVNLSSNLSAGGGLSLGVETWQLMATATSTSKLGTANAGTSFANIVSGGAINAATTGLPDVSANAVFVNVSTTMGGTTSKPQTGFMELVLMP